MKRSRILPLSLALLVPFVPVDGIARAAPATVIPIHHVQQLPAVNALPECFDDVEGVQVGTETFDGQVVITGDGSQHIRGTTTLVYEVTFPDGRYVTGVATEHITMNVNRSVTTSTVAIVEPRTVFDASGQRTGTVVLHAVSHLTYQAGVFRSAVDRFFFTCH
jgi:hypothetical protein